MIGKLTHLINSNVGLCKEIQMFLSIHVINLFLLYSSIKFSCLQLDVGFFLRLSNSISILFYLRKKPSFYIQTVKKKNSSEWHNYFHNYFLIIRGGGYEVQLWIKMDFRLGLLIIWNCFFVIWATVWFSLEDVVKWLFNFFAAFLVTCTKRK